jgi:prepilin-type N-terminal cleavage/methylation domain-containing protein
MRLHTSQSGFTLIETLVAITLLTVAITEPISLTTQSLASAYYARDQITAFYLAQEAIEAVRSLRDAQILQITQTAGDASSINIFGAIPLGDQTFRIDAREGDSSQAITDCSQDPDGVCIPLQTDGTLYGYQSGWSSTNFTRTVKAHFVKNADGSDNQEEVRVTVTVTWRTGAFQSRSFSISENLYRWVQDSSGAGT